MQTSYSELLKDPRWQKKRLEILEYADWRCQFCGNKNDRTLHVHHSYYTKGKMPWQYPSGSLVALCDCCHEKLHPEKPKKEPVYGGHVVTNGAERFAAMRAELDRVKSFPEPWGTVVSRVGKERPLLASHVEDTKLEGVQGNVVIVEAKSMLTMDLLDSPNNKKFLCRLLSETCKREMVLNLRFVR